MTGEERFIQWTKIFFGILALIELTTITIFIIKIWTKLN